MAGLEPLPAERASFFPIPRLSATLLIVTSASFCESGAQVSAPNTEKQTCPPTSRFASDTPAAREKSSPKNRWDNTMWAWLKETVACAGSGPKRYISGLPLPLPSVLHLDQSALGFFDCFEVKQRCRIRVLSSTIQQLNIISVALQSSDGCTYGAVIGAPKTLDQG